MICFRVRSDVGANLGTYAAKGAKLCAPCGVGHYDDDGDATTPCQLCARGTYTQTQGSMHCADCEVGT